MFNPRALPRARAAPWDALPGMNCASDMQASSRFAPAGGGSRRVSRANVPPAGAPELFSRLSPGASEVDPARSPGYALLELSLAVSTRTRSSDCKFA